MTHKTRPAPPRERFLKALAEGQSVTSAAVAANVCRRTPYRWRAEEPAFADSWLDSLEAGADRLEDEAFRRAVTGTEKPIYFNGAQIGSIREYSDSLLKFLLSAKRPAQFRERGTYEHNVVTTPPPEPVGKYSHLSDSELAAKYFQEFGVQPGFAQN